MSTRRSRLRVRPNVAIRGAAAEKKTPDTETSVGAEETSKPTKTNEENSHKTVVEDANDPVESSSTLPGPDVPSETTSSPIDKSKESVEVSSNVNTNPSESQIKQGGTARRSRIKPQVKLPVGKPSINKNVVKETVKSKVSGEDHSETRNNTQEDVTLESPANSVGRSDRLEANARASHEIRLSETSDQQNDLALEHAEGPCIQDKNYLISNKSPEIQKTFEDPKMAVKDKTVEASPTVKPVKRGWFPKAKPNIPASDKRRARLSSMSEQEDYPPGKKSKVANISSDSTRPVHDAADSTRQEDQLKAETSEVPKTAKVKRRVPIKLDSLVSENRNKFTIGDLIHMNPTINLMKRYQKDKTGGDPMSKRSESKDSNDPVDNLDSRPSTPQLPADGANVRSDPPDVVDISVDGKEEPLDENDGDLAPQVMIGPDGTIILNDASLVVDNPANKTNPAIVESDVVVENDNYDPSFYYKKKSRGQAWTIKETTKFYVALSTVGTDFSLMSALFSKRSRLDLKRKFKVEERKHKSLVDRAMRERRELDMSLFEEHSEEDEDDSMDNQENNAGGITQAIREELEKEKRQKSKKTGRKPKSTKETAAKMKKTAENSKRTRKKTKGRRKSKYYDDSEESEEDVQTNFEQDVETQECVTQNDDAEKSGDSSNEEESILEKVVSQKTRSGRQPKSRKPFQAEPLQTKRTRTNSLGPLTKLAPFVNLSPRARTQGIIEDEGTGQRLLLVKSPPPVGTPKDHRNTPADFVHVYLLSPPSGAKQDHEEMTLEQSQSVDNESSNQSFLKLPSGGTTAIPSPVVTNVNTDQHPETATLLTAPPSSNLPPPFLHIISPTGSLSAKLARSPLAVVTSPGSTHLAHVETQNSLVTTPSAMPDTVVISPPCLISPPMPTRMMTPAQLTHAGQSSLPACATSPVAASSPVPMGSVPAHGVCRPTPIDLAASQISESPQSQSFSVVSPTGPCQQATTVDEPDRTLYQTGDNLAVTCQSTEASTSQATTSTTPLLQSFDQAKITTIATEEGDIVEIFIDPGLMGDGNTSFSEDNPDGYRIYNIEVPNILNSSSETTDNFEIQELKKEDL